jgi:hypothetical protein
MTNNSNNQKDDSELAEKGVVVTEAMIEAGSSALNRLLAEYESDGVGYMQMMSKYMVKDIISACFRGV